MRKLKPGGRECYCRSCGQYFTSVGPFSAHRVGKIRTTPPSYGRRCLSAEEMLDRGMRQDVKGRWQSPIKALRRAAAAADSTISSDPVLG